MEQFVGTAEGGGLGGEALYCAVILWLSVVSWIIFSWVGGEDGGGGRRRRGRGSRGSPVSWAPRGSATAPGPAAAAATASAEPASTSQPLSFAPSERVHVATDRRCAVCRGVDRLGVAPEERKGGLPSVKAIRGRSTTSLFNFHLASVAEAEFLACFFFYVSFLYLLDPLCKYLHIPFVSSLIKLQKYLSITCLQ